MLNPHLLQLIRLEAAAFGSMADDLPCRATLDPVEVDDHVARLYFGGEIAGSCVIDGGRALVVITGLTPYGQREMDAFAARNPSTGDDEGR